MKKHLAIVLTFAFLALDTGAVSAAADCNKAAKKLARQENAEILSVAAAGEKCEVKLLIPGKDGNPPRVVTKTVSG
ncbi:MAG: hypothetical protein KDJ80_11600 [Nitratireductor sp.]|nr:hypothetical protein [Nitratireductor sp.]